MARNRGTAVVEDEGTEVEDTEVTTEVESAEATEAAVEANVEAEGTESPAETEAAAEAPAEADLTPFIEVASAVVEDRDKSTGALPEGGLDRVLEAYRELPDTKARNRAKKHLNSQMAEGMEALDLSLAKAYLTLHDNMTTSTATATRERKPADPTAAWRNRLEVVALAYTELSSQLPEGATPETVQEVFNGTAELREQMEQYRAWLDNEAEDKGDTPEVDGRVIQAFRVIRGGKSGGGSGRVSAPHDGPRRDVAKHIQSAFEGLDSGAFLSIAQIRAHKSEEYGDDHPSAGAISARLFPAKGSCTVEGVTPGTGGEKDTRGAYKA